MELIAYFEPPEPGQRIIAVPGAGLRVPIWLLGSSLFSAQLAAALGLPFAFASHFAPEAMMQALEVYRTRFRPSDRLDRPYAMVGVNIIAAATDAEARRLFTTLQQAFTNIRRGQRGFLQPPIDDIESYWSPTEKAGVEQALACSFVGSPETVKRGLRDFIARTKADELMVAGQIYDHRARVESYRIAAEVRDELAREAGAAD